MAIKVFSKEYLTNELDLPWTAIHDKIIDTGRWSIYHEIVFEDGGKYYQTNYSVGATERQYERPWEDENEIKCTEVEKRKVEVEQWVPVE